MKFTDKIKSKLSGMSNEDLETRIKAKEEEIRKLREQIKEAEEGLDLAAIEGNEEQAAAKLAELRERYKRAPGQLKMLRRARSKAGILQQAKEQRDEAAAIDKNLGKLSTAHKKMIDAIEAWNAEVENAGDLGAYRPPTVTGATTEAEGVKFLTIKKSDPNKRPDERYSFVDAVPSLEWYRGAVVSELNRKAAETEKQEPADQERSFAVYGGTPDKINSASKRERAHKEAIEKAKAGDPDAAAALALGEV